MTNKEQEILDTLADLKASVKTHDTKVDRWGIFQSLLNNPAVVLIAIMAMGYLALKEDVFVGDLSTISTQLTEIKQSQVETALQIKGLQVTLDTAITDVNDNKAAISLMSQTRWTSDDQAKWMAEVFMPTQIRLEQQIADVARNVQQMRDRLYASD